MSKEKLETETSEGSFGKHKIFEITVVGEEKNLIAFGVKKAKGILNHIDEIKKFVEENDK